MCHTRVFVFCVKVVGRVATFNHTSVTTERWIPAVVGLTNIQTMVVRTRQIFTLITGDIGTNIGVTCVVQTLRHFAV